MHIQNKVKLRRFEMVKLMENAEDLTGVGSPNFKVKEDGVDARVRIDFNMLVRRMVELGFRNFTAQIWNFSHTI